MLHRCPKNYKLLKLKVLFNIDAFLITSTKRTLPRCSCCRSYSKKHNESNQDFELSRDQIPNTLLKKIQSTLPTIDEHNKSLHEKFEDNCLDFVASLRYLMKCQHEECYPHPPKYIVKQQVFIDIFISYLEKSAMFTNEFHKNPSFSLYPSRNEKIEYMTILGVTMLEMNEIMKNCRLVWRSKQIAKRNFEGKEILLQRLHQFIQYYSNSPPLSQNVALYQIAREVGESPEKIRRMIAYLTEKRGTVTPEKRNILRKHIQQRPTWNQNDIVLLANQLKLSRQQVRQQISMILDPNGEITDWKRNIIRKVAMQRQYISSKKIKELQDETLLSKLQIRNLIFQYRSSIPLELKESIRNEIKNNPNENNLREKYLQLSQQFGVPCNRILRYARYHSSKSGRLTNENKIEIVNYLHKNHFAFPSDEELVNLAQNLQLSREQVRSFIRRIL